MHKSTVWQSLRKRPRAIRAAALALVLAVAAVDWASGPDFAMGLLYLIPVALVTVVLGRRSGLLTAVFTVLAWAVAELLGAAIYSHAWIVLPNALMRVAYFGIVVFLLSMWRDSGEELEAQVQQRTRELVAEIAERKRAEEANRRLTLQIVVAEDAERRRLAQDIHDSIGQILTLVKFRLQSAPASVVAGNGTEHEPRYVQEAVTLLETAIEQTRTLTFELYPQILDDLGLVAALRWLARNMSRHATIEITVTEEGEARTLRRSTGSYLFRSIKELINNAIKHGQSSEIIVTLYWRQHNVRATVDDNGAGFLAETNSVSGIGLASIRERVTMMGGSISIESEPGTGTRAILDVPTDDKGVSP